MYLDQPKEWSIFIPYFLYIHNNLSMIARL